MGFFKKLRNSKASKMMMAGLTAACLTGQSAQALPDGATVTHGTATINVGGQQMTIQQASQQAIINWNGFNISAGELVQFIQPSQLAAVLNRVTGVDPSVINGILQGNGNIFLINPNGVLIGPGGMVNAGGFLASTLQLNDADFLSGNLHFQQTPGMDLAAVVNQGRIEVAPGGFVTLLAPSVASEGVILALGGEVTLAAGTEATVNFDGQNLINFALGSAPAGNGTMVMSQASANNVLAQVVNSLGIEEAGSLSVDGSVEASRVLMQGGDVNVASQTVRATDIIANADGNLILNSQFALDGGNIIGTATAGNITFDTLVAEPLNGQGGLVRLTAGGHSSSSPTTGQSVSSGGNIIMNSGGEGIAADRVELDATGDISSTIAANTVLANAPNGNVSLNLQAGVIDGIAGSDTGSSPGITGGTTGGSSPGTTGGTTGGVSPGITGGTSGSTGGTSGSSSSSSSSSTGAFPSGRNDGVFGVPPGGSGSSSSSSSSNTTGTSGGSSNLGQRTLQQSSSNVGTLVGQNGTLVTVNAGGNVNIDSVNTVIVDRVTGRNVNIRSQTGSVVDNGDIVGADNRDIIATQNANLSAKDFLGTVDDPLEVDIGGDLNVFAANEVDGISGVLVGLVNGRYLQDSETAGVVLLNPGSNLTDGVAQAQRGVVTDNNLPGDETIGGGAVANFFFLRLVNAIEEEDWLEILRGTVVWEDSEEEAQEEDL